MQIRGHLNSSEAALHIHRPRGHHFRWQTFEKTLSARRWQDLHGLLDDGNRRAEETILAFEKMTHDWTTLSFPRLATAAAIPIPTLDPSSTRAGSGTSTKDAWQHWGNMERQLAMMKVVRTLQQEDSEGTFSRKLDDQALEVGSMTEPKKNEKKKSG